jgi:hypothetical protein
VEDHGGGRLMSYVAISALVLVKVRDEVGDGFRIDYHYAGSVIPHLDAEQRERLLGEGHVRDLGGSVTAEVEGGSGDPGQPPPKAGSLPAWQEWAKSKGASGEDIEKLTKADLIELYG